MDTPLIEFRDVTKSFNGQTVLDGVNLSIYERQITTIIGKSGSGKSVLLKHIIGLLEPDSGTVLFEGQPVNRMKRGEWNRYRGQISYMFQNNALFDSMTVFDNVALPLTQTTRLSRKVIEEKVKTRLEQTDLADAAGKYPSELSGGMQKRVALARALITDPKVVLFDEPTTGQDPIRRNVILSMISEYRRKFDFTAVLISHDIPDVYFISDRIILLWEGKIGFQGSYGELTGFSHPMINEFLESVEGLRDGLTGLISRQVFRSRYMVTQTRGQPGKAITGILFNVEFDQLSESLGPSVAVEVLKVLGDYVNRKLGGVGGFSARFGRGEILTVLPYADVQEAEQMLGEFSRNLQNGGLSNIQSVTGVRMGVDACYEIHVYASVVQINPNDDFEAIIHSSMPGSRIVARIVCERGGDGR
jgi:phospholipid/cholesterol/gamma-HCH transport system ATP-binding protein